MDDDLRAALADLPPKSRDLLRRVLIGDDEDRNVISAALLRYRDAGDELSEHDDASLSQCSPGGAAS